MPIIRRNKLLKSFFNSWGLAKNLIVFFATTILVSGIYANPVLDNVASGNVSIQQTPGSTVVNQSSGKAIINWQSFNIGASESTHFNQPTGGVALNRINPNQGVSQIFGSLSATGQIILINPAGIYFGPSARVNVGGLIATTGNMTDQDFLNGQYRFTNAGAYNGSIINEGTIIAANNGLVALVAPSVVNTKTGVIQANAGQVILGSGNAFTVSFDNSGLINFTIDAKTTSAGRDQNGNELRDGVRNVGSLIADGGKVLVSARAASGVLDNVINMEGIVLARSVSQNGNGEIIFSGDPDSGVVRVAANVDASGKGVGQKGGKVHITGHNILIDSPTTIDVSGDVGGGEILIGGNYQGKGPLPNSNAVAMMSGAKLIADAITTGKGGDVILWSDYFTNAKGSISARGGAQSGDGGFIETSSHGVLDVNDIAIDTSAAHGKFGQWLLDPADLTINAGSDSNVTGSTPFQPTATGSILNVTTLTNALLLSDVTVQTLDDGFSGTGDVRVNAAISWSNANSLTLSAYRNVVLNTNITNTGGASVVLRADNTGTGTGTVCGGGGTTVCSGFSPTGLVTLSGGSGVVRAYYNPAVFGTPDTLYSGGGSTAPIAYMLVQQLGASGDTTTASLASISNSTAMWNKNFALARNIDASATSGWNSGAGFSPIGNSSTNYSGNFDGLGYEIQNLTINRPGTSEQGFFGRNSGTIRNLGITDASVTGLNTVGGLAGFNFGAITGSYTTGTVTSATHTVGGLVGFQSGSGSIANSHSDADVSLTSTTGGGLVGFVFNGTTITNSYATGDVNGNGTASTLGGFAGGIDGTVTNSYASGYVYGGTSSLGGFAGVVGSALAGSVSDSFALGNVVGSSTQIGGFVGSLQSGTISNSYSIGYVSGSSSVGGFAGTNSGTISNSFWDTTSSNRGSGTGGGGGTSTTLVGGCFSGTLCSFGATADLSDLATYTTAGWDTTNVWNILPDQSYAYLRPIFTSTPRVITTTGVAPTTNTQMNLIVDGQEVATARVQASGATYFIFQNGQIADDAAILLYLNDGVEQANALGIAPTGGDSLSGSSAMIIIQGQINIGGFFGGSFSNAVLAAAKGSISDSDILYSISDGDVILSANTSFALNPNATYTMDGDITVPSGSFTANGPIALPVGITNPTITVSGGATVITNDVEGGGNTLTINTTSGGEISGVMSNLSSFTKSGTGSIILSGTNTYTGKTIINGGTLSISAENNLGANPGVFTADLLTLDGGTLQTTGSFSLDDSNRGITLGAGGGTFEVNTGSSDTITLPNVIAGTGSLTKTGDGVLNITGIANTYTGQTIISQGTINAARLANFGVNSSLGAPASGDIVLGSSQPGTLVSTATNSSNRTFSIGGTGGGTIRQSTLAGDLTLSGNITTALNQSLTLDASLRSIVYSGAISGAGNVTISSLNLSGVQFSGTNTYTGTTTVTTNAGLNANSAGALGNGVSGTSGITVQSGAQLSLGSNITFLGAPQVTITGVGLIGNQGSFITSNGTFNGNIVLAGDATIWGGGTLGGNINNAGNALTFVTTGTGSLIANGVISGSGGVTAFGDGGGSSSITFGNTANTYSGVTSLGGDIRLIVSNLNDAGNDSSIGTASSISLGGTLEYTGGTTSTNRQISGSGTIRKTAAGTLTLSGNIANNGLTFDTVSSSGSIVSSGLISGTGSLTKRGTGTLSLNNIANTYTGQTIINNGSILAAKLDDFGQTSSIGQAAAGAILLGDSFAGTTGTLVALGSADSTNRTFATLVGGGSIEATAGTLDLSGNISMSNGSPIRFNANGGNINESGIISGGNGGAGVYVNGDGSSIVTLSGTNTYVDVTQVNSGGILNITNPNALGDTTNNFGITVNSGGQLRLDIGSATLANDTSVLTLNGSGPDGNGALYNFPSGIDSNVLENPIVLASATTIGSANAALLELAGGIDNAGFLLTFTGGAITSSTGTITGTGGLTINGGTAVILASGNTYTGTTTITDGSIRFNGSDVLDNNNVVSIGALGELELLNNSDIIGELNGAGVVRLGSGTLILGGLGTSSIYSGVIEGTGNITKNGAGTFTLSGNNTYSGTTTINAGTIALGVANALATNSSLNINGTLDLAGFSQEIADITGGAGTITNSGASATFTLNNAGAITYGGVFSGANLNLTKTGVGTLNLINANTYGGTTTINGGTVAISDPDALGTTAGGTVINNGQLTLTNVVVGNENVSLSSGILASIGDSSLSGALTLGAATTNTVSVGGGNTLALSGAINGPGALEITGAGETTLSGNIGSTTALSSFSTNAGTVLNSSIVNTTGNQVYANVISLNGNKTLSSSAGNITFMGAINGGFDLAVSSGGTTQFDTAIGAGTALNSLAITASGITLNGGSVSTVGNQSYTGLVTLGADTNFSTSAASNTTIAINSGLAGNRNVNLTAGALSSNETFILAGTLNANSITVTGGSGGGNSLTVNSGNAQNWNITATDGGNVTGAANGNVTYTNVTNLTGSSGNDNFIFNNSGAVNNINGSGGSNALDYTAVSYGVNIALIGNITSGTASRGVNTFSNIDNLKTSLSNTNTLQLPNKTNVITITSAGAGYIGDPTYFTGMTGFDSTSQTDTVNFATSSPVTISGNSANVDGTNMTFNNFGSNAFSGNIQGGSTPILDPSVIPTVMEQAASDQDATNEDQESESNYVMNTVSDNITDMINDINTKFDSDLNKVKINPYCYSAQ